jgi:hypothetical protein
MNIQPNQHDLILKLSITNFIKQSQPSTTNFPTGCLMFRKLQTAAIIITITVVVYYVVPVVVITVQQSVHDLPCNAKSPGMND